LSETTLSETTLSETTLSETTLSETTLSETWNLHSRIILSEKKKFKQKLIKNL
jgi:uncharacterized protein YjbI with pentapeptide repeats